QADRAKTTATFREILNAMWLFNEKFERAAAKFNEIKAQKKAEWPRSRRRSYSAGMAFSPPVA
ncbi:MAG: hypothetical protein WAL48_26095, partial [Xanthobacteraceae bacterium]